MNFIDAFQMPRPVKITGRTSSITNAFVNGIIPCVYPSSHEIQQALEILGLEATDLRCAYCGDPSTEWDHLRPLVRNKRPTGYISHIFNLVPSCSKCNQSKGGRHWKEWINSSSPKAPKKRGIIGIEEKIRRLEAFERWHPVEPIDFRKIVGEDLWANYWKRCDDLHSHMNEIQATQDKLRKMIEDQFR